MRKKRFKNSVKQCYVNFSDRKNKPTLFEIFFPILQDRYISLKKVKNKNTSQENKRIKEQVGGANTIFQTQHI